MRYVVGLVSLLITPFYIWAAGETVQTITVDGTLFDSTNHTNPLLDNNVLLTIQILDPTKACILYEEQQTVDTTTTNGQFNIQVGSEPGNAKRVAANDPNHDMATILQNVTAMSTDVGCAGTYTPSARDQRYLRITVDPTVGGPETMSPDLTISAVPNALVAESVQGLDKNKIAEFGTHLHANMTPTNLLNLFDGSNVGGGLHNHDSLYARLNSSSSITLGAQETIGLGQYTTAQQTTLTGGLNGTTDVGKIWVNSTTNKVMYWDGTQAVDVAQAGGDFQSDGSVAMTGALNLNGQNAINSGHITMNAQMYIQIGRFDNAQEATLVATPLTAAHKGVTIFNTDSNSMKVWNGSAFVAVGGGLSDLVGDTTPQLGGQLDVNGNALGDGTLELVTFTETGSAVNQLNITNAATGNGPSLTAAGDDTNIDLNLDGKGTGQVVIGSSNLDVTGNITVSGTVDGIDIATDVAANTAKVTNATHTGDVTGSGALTIDPTAISGKTTVTAVATDMLLLWDATDSTLKKTDASNFLSVGISDVVSDTTPQLGGNLDINGNSITSTAAFPITTGSSAGHDLTVNTSALVVEGDTGNVGVGTAAPGSPLTVAGNGGNPLIDVRGTNDSSVWITSAGTGDYPYMIFRQGATAQYEIGVTGTVDPAGGDLFYISNNPQNGSVGADLTINASGNVGIGTATPGSLLELERTYTASSGTETVMQVLPTFNQSGTAGYTALLVNATETATGSGERLIMDLQDDGTSVFKVNSFGQVTVTNAIYGTGLSIGPMDSTVYASSSGASSSPTSNNFISSRNNSNTDGVGAYNFLTTRNAAGNYQGAYIAAVSNSGGGARTPEVVFGQQTGATAYEERMRLKANGHLGIGVTSPTSMLDINGAFTVQEMTAPAVSATGDGRIYFDSTANKFRVSENGGAYVDLVNSGGLSDVVGDTTPQLGGQLDVNGNALGDGTLELVTFTETGSAVNQLNITNAATGNGPSLTAAGDDTNIDLNLDGKGTGQVVIGSSNLDVTGNITVSGTVDGIDIATDVAANTAKVTNATHTGDVTGSVALTIDPTAISGKTTVTAVATDMLLLWDATDSTLKKADANDFLSAGISDVVSDTTPQLGGSLDVNGNSITSAAALPITTGSSAGHDLTVNTSALVVEGDNGYVGIGTASPTGVLNVDGGTAAADTNGTHITLKAESATGNNGYDGGNIDIIPGVPTSFGERGSLKVWHSGFATTILGANNGDHGFVRISQLNGDPTIQLNSATASYMENGLMVGSSNSATSTVDVSGNLAIGSSYAGTSAAPTNGLIVEGRVGIGTTSPSGILHVEGGTASSGNGTDISISAEDAAAGNNNGGWISLTPGSATGSGSAGSVVVRRTTSSVASGQGHLDLMSWDAPAANNGAALALGAYDGTTHNALALVGGYRDNATAGNNSGYMAFSTRTNGSNPAERMRITSTGDVGIGLTSPTTKLDINGAINMQEMSVPAVSASGDGRIYFDSTSKKFRVSENGGAFTDLLGGGGITDVVSDLSPQLGGTLDMNGQDISTANGFNINITGSAGGDDFTVDTNKLVVEGDTGNVGIGTATPGADVHIDQTGVAMLLLQGGGDTWNYSVFELRDDAGNSKWQFANKKDATIQKDFQFAHHNGTSWSYPLHIKTTGLVGIGTTAPTTQLHVRKDQAATTAVRVENQNAGAAAYAQHEAWNDSGAGAAVGIGSAASAANVFGDRAYLWSSGASNGLSIIASGAADDIRFFTGGESTSEERMRIDGTGKVSVGTNSAALKFHVADGASGFSGAYNSRSVAVFEGDEANGAIVNIMSKNTGLAGFFLGDEDAVDRGQIYYNNSDDSMWVTTQGGTHNLIYSGGNLGVGGTPYSKLDVYGAASFKRLENDHSSYGAFTLLRQRADSTSPNANFGVYQSAVLEGSTDGTFPVVGQIGYIWEVNQTNDTTARDAAMIFETMVDNSISEKVRITSAGNFGIGIAGPTSKLDVNGAVTIQEMAAPAVSSAGDGRIYFDSTSKKFLVSENGGAYVNMIPGSAHLLPSVDNTYDLGSGGARWGTVYAGTGTINTSDARLKTEVEEIEGALDAINTLRPVSYKWNDGSSNKTHMGFLAQEVDQQYSSSDYALVDYDENSDRYGLRYGEFTALLVRATQQLSNQSKMSDQQISKILEKAEANERKISSLQEENKNLNERVKRLEELVEKLIEAKK